MAISSGTRLHNSGKIRHAKNVKVHYFDWAIFHSYVTIYERVSFVWRFIRHVGTNGWTTIKMDVFPGAQVPPFQETSMSIHWEKHR